MKALTYTLYKEHCELKFNGCQIKLAQKDIILLSNVFIIVYRTGKCTGVENKLIYFNLSAGTYSTGDFNAKIRVAILQKRQDWELL